MMVREIEMPTTKELTSAIRKAINRAKVAAGTMSWNMSTFWAKMVFKTACGRVRTRISSFSTRPGDSQTNAGIAVAQRTSEIGLLKAIGAPAADIRRLFFAEALWLSLAGGAERGQYFAAWLDMEANLPEPYVARLACP